jgi:crotonobetainyl-CoA:carnitine CoA-transferase CaiB-like acyl-CoA transferase
MASPQLAHNGTIVEMDHPVAGKVRMPGFALGDRDAQSRVRYAPPTIAQHSRGVLGDFCFAAAEIDALVRSGTVIESITSRTERL